MVGTSHLTFNKCELFSKNKETLLFIKIFKEIKRLIYILTSDTRLQTKQTFSSSFFSNHIEKKGKKKNSKSPEGNSKKKKTIGKVRDFLEHSAFNVSRNRVGRESISEISIVN